MIISNYLGKYVIINLIYVRANVHLTLIILITKQLIGDIFMSNIYLTLGL